MFTLRPAAPTTKPEYLKQNVNVFAPALEGYVGELAERFPHLNFGLTPALETQQLDASEKQAAIDQIQSTIDDYTKKHPATGAMNVYLLDGKGVAGMDEQNEGPLRAVVAQVLLDPAHTVAALLPEDPSVSSVDDLSPASMLRALADTVLTADGVTVLVGKQATESYLAGLNDGSIIKPSNEGMVGAVVLGVLGAALVGDWIHTKVTDYRKARALPEAEKREKMLHATKDIQRSIEHIKKFYGNSEWLAKQKFVEGPINGHGITAYLSKGQGMPNDIHAAVEQHLRSILDYHKQFFATEKAYSKQANAIADRMFALVRAGKEDEAIALGEKELSKLKNPFEQHPPKLAGLLGNPVLDVETDLKLVTFGKTDDSKSQLPPLTREQVPSVLATLVKLLESLHSTFDDFNHFGDQIYNDADNWPDDMNDFWESATASSDVVQKTFSEYDQIHSYGVIDYSMVDSLRLIAVALERWLERSIKR